MRRCQNGYLCRLKRLPLNLPLGAVVKTGFISLPSPAKFLPPTALLDIFSQRCHVNLEMRDRLADALAGAAHLN